MSGVDWDKFKSTLTGTPEWETAADLSRMSIEAFIRENGGDSIDECTDEVWHADPTRQVAHEISELRKEIREFRQALYSFMMEYTEPE